MRLSNSLRIAAIAALAPTAALAGSTWTAKSTEPVRLAQIYPPPAAIPGESEPAPQTDVASLLVRILRLEDQVRTLNGQVEQLQFAQKQLLDDLQKFQKDVDFRFQDVEHGSGAAGPSPAARASAASPSSQDRPRRSDAFDPDDHPDAPGAPRQLGTLPHGEAAADGPDAPLQLDNGPVAPMGAPSSPAPVDGGARRAMAQAQPPAPPADPREDFDLALVSYNNGQLGAAEAGFRGFLTRHPKDRLAPEAVYDLGEIYWRGGKIRDAARQYLKISTDYPKSPHAPESLLKLGLSLEKLGSRDQACASFEQVTRKYPNASASIRASVARNLKRDKC